MTEREPNALRLDLSANLESRRPSGSSSTRELLSLDDHSEDASEAEILELINLARGFLIQHGKPARTPPPTEGSGRHNGWQRTDLRRSHMAHAIARREPTFRGTLRDVLRCPCCLM
jgi:hypothetical protein